MFEAIQAFDTSALLFIQNSLRSDALTTLMQLFSKLGDMGAVWILLGVVFFASRKYRNRGFRVIITVAVCWLICEGLRFVFARPRPYDVIPQLTVLIEELSSASFPSGHACASFAAAYAYTRGFKYGGIAYIGAVLIALSRPYLGVHYLTDVIGGAIIGTVFAVIVYAILEKYVRIPEYETDTIEVDDDDEADGESGGENGE